MRASTLAIALTLLPVAALAQIGNPAFMAPDTRFDAPGVPAPGQANTTDKLFAQLTAEGGLAEINMGELAAGKAQSSAVGDFARRMIDDHSAANDNLASIAEQLDLVLPDTLNPEHATRRAQLEDLDGAAFDIAYMRGQVVDHQKTTQLLIWEIGSGQDAALQKFAAQTLPAVLQHLKQAREIVAALSQNQVSDASRARN